LTHRAPRGSEFRRAGLTAALVLVCAAAATLRADVILTAQNLNEALKNMARFRKQIGSGAADAQAEAVFKLGIEADMLATLLSDEVIAHGDQEKPLIDLALERTREMQIAIAYNREKQKFFYDGAAFRDYLARAPKGPRAAQARYQVIEGDFYQSAGSDITAVLNAARAKADFLAAYPKFELNREVHLMLAIDYRDLFRMYGESGNLAKRAECRDLVRREYRTILRRYPGTEQAEIAGKLLARFEKELENVR
jgi:hypothetical protein